MLRGFPRPCSLGWMIGFYLNEPQQNKLYAGIKMGRILLFLMWTLIKI